MKLILALILSLFSLNSLAESFGLIITYKASSEADVLKLHQRLNTRVEYRSTKSYKHVVVSNDKALSYKEGYLKTLCDLYLKEKIIKKCELNKAVKAREEAGLTCEPESDDPLVELRGLGSFFSGLTKTKDGCSVTNPHKIPKIRSNGGNSRMPGRFDNDEITPLWAQEYIGADLAYRYMEDLNRAQIRAGKPQLSVKDGVIDTGFESESLKEYPVEKGALKKVSNLSKFSKKEIKSSNEHGTSVISLMVHPKYGSSPVAKLSLVHEAKWDSNMIEGLERAIDNGTQIINISTNVAMPVVDTMKEINKNNIIIVTAAGNDFNNGKKQVDVEYNFYDQIVVGSLSPTGYVSEFSQQGLNVSVLAPSDYWVSAKAGGKRITFGGTSGASPLVKGALDNVLAQVPGLTTKQLKVLIEKTAVDVFATETKGHYRYHNGVGMINAYKLAKVATKLRQNLGKLKGKNRTKKIDQLINGSDLYDFKRESKSEYLKGLKLSSSKDCNDRIEGFKLIRSSYMLSMDEKVRKKIVDIYEDDGKDVNAEFYKSVTKDRDKYTKEMNSELFHKHVLHHPASERK